MEICSACHPFFTGKQKLVDTAGRVDRFNKRYGKKTPAETPLLLLSNSKLARTEVVDSQSTLANFQNQTPAHIVGR